MNLKKDISIGLILLFGLIVSGCGIYSMAGVNIPEGVKTTNVQYFPNKARIVAPILSQVFTEKLQDKLINETKLELVNESAHLNFSGSIVNYIVGPTASGSNDIAALNRLTIKVQVKFENVLSGEEWTETFSRFSDFEKDVNLKDAEDELIEDITEQLVGDIFNKALVNW